LKLLDQQKLLMNKEMKHIHMINITRQREEREYYSSLLKSRLAQQFYNLCFEIKQEIVEKLDVNIFYFVP
jgi:hypothetical protein